MNLGFGHFEILVILVIALVVIGPRKLPEMLRSAGKLMGQLRRASDELRNEILYSDEFRSIQDSIKDTKENFTPPPVPPPLRTKKQKGGQTRDTEETEESSATPAPLPDNDRQDCASLDPDRPSSPGKPADHDESRKAADQGKSSDER